MTATVETEKTDQEWREQLTAEQYRVTRQSATEAPFSGAYWDNHDPGDYLCVCCGAELFSSDAKFDSGTGWPSFSKPENLEHVELRQDTSLPIPRTEVICKNCGAHLGHVFDDGPPEHGGLRYCVNSCALAFESE